MLTASALLSLDKLQLICNYWRKHKFLSASKVRFFGLSRKNFLVWKVPYTYVLLLGPGSNFVIDTHFNEVHISLESRHPMQVGFLLQRQFSSKSTDFSVIFSCCQCCA